ncbi:MAG TPA: hypothetical protein VFD13_05870 [Candidatus Kapabacteria bacterium]|nr:hypothetical protein [Candidatus Kapabacteria bacterium]
MNDDQEHSQPRMLTMHKRVTKTTDGKRQLIFYTFDQPPLLEPQLKVKVPNPE